jgi:glycosyltransferase involved in cell wall biosynthesis
MKILFISAGLPPKHGGGLPAYVKELMEGLANRGHDIHYLDTFCLTPRPWVTLRPRAGDPRHRELFNTGTPPDIEQGTREPLRQVYPTRRTKRLVIDWVKLVAPDVIHIHEFLGFPSRLATDIAGLAPVTLFTAHDYHTLCPTVRLFHKGAFNCNLPAEKLDCDICCSDAKPFSFYAARTAIPPTFFERNFAPLLEMFLRPATALRFRRRKFVARRREFVKMLNGLSAVICISDLQRKVFSGAGVGDQVLRRMTLTRRTFVHLGVHKTPPSDVRPLKIWASNVYSTYKGAEVIEREFGLLRQRNILVELEIYGHAGIGSSNPLISFKGEYQAADLDRICRDNDAGLIPSIWRETYGYIGPEMMTRGLPVFVSSEGAMKEYVTDGKDGVVFDPHRVGALADAVARFAQDGEFRRRLLDGVRDSREKFQRFDEHVAQTESLYVELRKK